MYQALFATSQTIIKFIDDGIIPIKTSQVFSASLNTPAEMRSNGIEGVSVWLYRVVRDPERLNDPLQRVGFNQFKPPPLPLRLHYLITPITGKDKGPAAL